MIDEKRGMLEKEEQKSIEIDQLVDIWNERECLLWQRK